MAKRGRPRGSKNKKNTMAIVKSNIEETRPYSFDLLSIRLLSAVEYIVRKAIEDKAVELAENKQCIPPNIIESAIIKLKLEQYIPEN